MEFKAEKDVTGKELAFTITALVIMPCKLCYDYFYLYLPFINHLEMIRKLLGYTELMVAKDNCML